MKKTITTLSGLLLASWLSAQLTGPFVWPGDLNDNGIVNEVDVLYWGIAYGAQGPSRKLVDGSYIGYPTPDAWTQFFNPNLNYLYADANGDGQVNDADLQTIDRNFNLRNSATILSDAFPQTIEAPAPPIHLQLKAPTDPNSPEITFEISLGDATTPVDSFYGFSFRLHYDSQVAPNGLSLKIAAENWIEQSSNELRMLVKDFPDQGLAQVALTRIDQQTVSGAGVILRGIIVVEDIVFTPGRDSFVLELDSARLITNHLMGYQTTPVRASITNLAVPASSATPIAPLKIFPNPCLLHCWLQTQRPEERIQEINVYNALGQPQAQLLQDSDKLALSVQHWPTGMYFLLVRTNQGLYTEKILIP
jgi:hypothetical protein